MLTLRYSPLAKISTPINSFKKTMCFQICVTASSNPIPRLPHNQPLHQITGQLIEPFGEHVSQLHRLLEYVVLMASTEQVVTCDHLIPKFDRKWILVLNYIYHMVVSMYMVSVGPIYKYCSHVQSTKFVVSYYRNYSFCSFLVSWNIHPEYPVVS